MPDPTEILSVVLSEFADADKWVDATFEHIRRIPNTHVGSVGQAFVEKLCEEFGFECVFPIDAKGKRSKNSPWDIQIDGIKFELKTATEDVDGNFQFNHIRYHRPYDALLCIGVGPESIQFDAWSAADVKTEKAGHLVSMEKHANASYKLTKRKGQLRSIEDFGSVIKELIKRTSE